MEYSAQVKKGFARACQQGALTVLDETVFADAEDRTLGVWVRCSMQIDADRITDIGFEVFGCPDTIAAAQCAADKLVDVAWAQVDTIQVPELAKELDIPAEKLGKLLRIEDAVLACIERVSAIHGVR